MKSLILLSKNIKEKNLLSESFLNNHTIILENDDLKINDIKNIINSSYTNLTLVYHFNRYLEIPFFKDNGFNKYKYISDDLYDFIKYAKTIINNLTIDILACNLNFKNIKEEIKNLENELDITVRYSTDLTGNLKGNWILESHNINIKDLYFNENIVNWKYDLITNIYLSDLVNVAPEYFGYNASDSYYYLKKDLKLPQPFFPDNSYAIMLKNNNVFDGNNFSIKTDSTWGPNFGIFNTDVNIDIDKQATIRNLRIFSYSNIASGCGNFIGGSLQRFVNIENCISEFPNLGDNAGGFVGSSFGTYSEHVFTSIYTGKIINCVSKGKIFGARSGGITGSYCAYNYGKVLISKCVSYGEIYGNNSGGIVGEKGGYYGTLTIRKCYSYGNITGNNSGGIAGAYLCYLDGNYLSPAKNSNVVIEYCHSEGQINNYCGGIVGAYAANAKNCLTGYGGNLRLVIWTCFSTGNIVGLYSGGIVGPYASYNTKDFSPFISPLEISRCFSLTDITLEGAGGICASNLCDIKGKALIEYCYSVGEIGLNNGGIVGQLWSGYITINECYSQNINKSSVIETNCGGILGSNGNSKSITINKCYYESYNTSIYIFGLNCYLELQDIQYEFNKLEDLKYSIGEYFSDTNWFAGQRYNDIYPKIRNMCIPAATTNAEGYDYKYLTNLRTPVFYYQDPAIKENEVVFYLTYPGLVSTVITEDEVIDLRDWMFNYIFSQNPSQNFFYVSKQGMCVNILPENRKQYFISDYYIIYKPNKPAITINPYDSNMYNGIYCPLFNSNDTFKYISVDDTTSTEKIIERLTDFNFLQNVYKYRNHDNFSESVNNSYTSQMIYKFLLYYSGCCFIPRILPPVEILNITNTSTITANIAASITFKNDLYINPSISAGYKIINYYLDGNIWKEKWYNIVFFNEISNNIANFIDPNWSDPGFTYDGKTYGYRIIGLGINNWYNSGEYFTPIIFNYPYLDVSITQEREPFQEVKIIENGIVSNLKYITGGIIVESTKISTPKLSKITLNTGRIPMPIGGSDTDDESLNFTWDTPLSSSNRFIIKRYYFINNQYILDNTYNVINKNFFNDTEWDKNKDIILYTVTALGDDPNSNSEESLKMSYYNTSEKVVIIGDILCNYFKYNDSSEKILFKEDNSDLFNYFKNFSGDELSNKRSKLFSDYFLTSGLEEPNIIIEKKILNFNSNYKRPSYSAINYNYYKNLYGYIKLSDFTFEYNDSGLYIPVSDEYPEIIFYANDNIPDLNSEFYRLTKYSNNSDLFFALDKGNLNNNYFIPISDSVIYSLNDIFYINNYKLICGSFTVEDKGPVPCFTDKTKILTPNGYTNIENIKAGDYIITPDYRKVKIKNIIINIMKGTKKTYPYIVEKNSISYNYPIESFTISGDHLILYKNKWILPKNIPNIKQDTTQKIIKYYHIELENYETDHLIINNGTIVESFGGYKKHIDVYIKRIKNLV